MIRSFHALAALLIVMLIAACSGNSSPEEPAEMTTVVLSVGADGGLEPQGVPMGPGGDSVVEHFEVTVVDRNGDPVTFDADNVYDPEGHVSVLSLAAGDTSVTVRLPTGRYTFRTKGLETPGGPLVAYGETVTDVTHETTTVDLRVDTLIGSAELEPEGLRRYIKPGEVLDLYLAVRTVEGAYRVPIADFSVEYRMDDDLGELIGSQLGARIEVTPSPSHDYFEVKAVVRGWGLEEGEPASNRKVSATFRRPFLHNSGITVDVDPPALQFDALGEAPVGHSVTLTGAVDDDVGVDRVLVFEGPVLIGSTASDDLSADVARVTITDSDTGTWEMEWEPPTTGTYTLTAVAIDTSGNEAQVEVELVVVAGAPAPGSVGELKSVSGDEPLDEELGNCAATELGLPGQGLQAVGAGLQAVGAAGGLFIGPAASFSGSVATAEKVAGEILGLTGPTSYYQRVAIIVVDEFDGVYALPDELTSGDPVPEGRLEELAANGQLTHGALVLHHVLALVRNSGHGPHSTSSNAVTGEPLYLFDSGAGAQVAVQTVDTAGRDTAQIVATIRASFDHLSRTGELGYTDFVVNMSFAVVPCAVAADLGASSVSTFEEYVTAVRLVNGIGEQYEDDLTELLTSPLGADDDPLLAYLDCPLPAIKHGKKRCDGGWENGGFVLESLVHVASSGNLGHDFALYPAAWPTVVSVSSLDVVHPGYSSTRSAYANSGEVSAPGALFALVTTSDDQVLAYAGTSFSAPVVSVFSALDLATGPMCAPADLSIRPGTAPDLAHGSYDDTPLETVFGGAGSAMDLYCGE